tara:strand:- start:713 stop:2167 length:1455 start_codon:yes stop_codon:yes gene_type:complete
MNIVDNSGKGLAALGRNEDRFMAHVAKGEMVVPPVISDKTKSLIKKEMQAVGLDPKEYEVGVGMSINPITGQAEFGFLKKLAKSVKKVVKKVAPVASVIPGPWQPFAAVYNKGNAALKLAKGEGGLGDIMTVMAGGNQSVFGKDGALERIKAGTGIMSGTANLDALKNIGQVAKRDAAGNIMKDAAGKTITEFSPIAYGSNVLKGMASDQKQGYGGIFGGGTGQFNVTTGELDSFGYVDAFGNPISASDYAALDPATQKAFSPVTQGINLTGGQSITDIMGGKGPIEYASSKLLPQSIEDALNTGPGGDGIFSGGGGGGSGIDPKMAALALLYGKAVKDAAKRTEGGLTDIRQSVRPDLNPAPTFAGFDLGIRKAAAFGGPIGYGRQQFNKGGLAVIQELDMRQGGESVGPGTGTSDDIPAMLSDGEFVMTAAANNGAGGFKFNKTKKGIELIAASKPNRKKGVDVMSRLMDTFERYNESGSMA